MADLAAVAGDTRQRPAADDHSAAEADLAGEEDHVIRAGRGAAPVLGESSEVGLVGDHDRRRRAQCLGEHLAQRHVAPPEVRSSRDESVVPTHDADDRHPDPDQRMGAPRHGRAVGERGEVSDDVVDAGALARPVDADELEDLSAHPDHGHGEGVDGDLERQDDGAFGLEPHDRRRAAGQPQRLPRASTTSPAATRSPTSRRIPLRVSPVRSPSSERDSGPSAWSTWTSALRLARRMLSLRCPLSPRPVTKIVPLGFKRL